MDVFRALLGGGIKFNRKKYAADFELFQSQTSQETETPELDFFGEAKQALDIEPVAQVDGQDSDDEKVVEEEEIHETIATEAQAIAFRKQNAIKTYGTDVPYPITSFGDLGSRYSLERFLKKNIASLGFEAPSPIQMQSIPLILETRDVMACAPTGSGKTLAFLIPMLQSLKAPSRDSGFRGLIITPTRELAQQIHRELKALTQGRKFKVCVLNKALNLNDTGSIQSSNKYDILISTPMRLVTAIQKESIELDTIKHLVLDEADRLLDLGFLEQMDDIVHACSNVKLQISLFSATIPSGIEQIAQSIMKEPVRIVIGVKNAATETIDQKLLYVGQEEGKLIAIRQCIAQGLKPPVLIFVQSIDRAKQLFSELVYDGINVDVIHSERTRAQRDAIVSNFRSGKVWVLIATELLARGIDFKGVNLVINYDFPQTVQSYIHRIGRTGRAGRVGTAITYFTKEDGPYLKSIVNVMKESGCDVPEWMLKLKNPSKNLKKSLKQMPVDRTDIKTQSEYDIKNLKRKRDLATASKRRKEKLN